MSRQEVLSILEAEYPSVEPEMRIQLADFYQKLVTENQTQNLTRLTGARDFIEGHLVDAMELITSEFVEYPAMDLGSGGGSPGLLCAILGYGPWVLIDSEKKKADFLTRTIDELEIDTAGAFGMRGEDWLRTEGDVETVVAKAVGPIDRIWGWIGRCSTWNKLVLLKSRGWVDEWKKFEEEHRGRTPLKITRTYEYEVGAEKKYRVIVELVRVKKKSADQ